MIVKKIVLFQHDARYDSPNMKQFSTNFLSQEGMETKVTLRLSQYRVSTTKANDGLNEREYYVNIEK